MKIKINQPVFLAFLFLIFFQSGKAQNILKIGNYQIAQNKEFSVDFEINNSDQFVAFQADLVLPENFQYVENSAILNPDRASGHTLSANVILGNKLRLIAYSAGNSKFKGNTGKILSFKLKAGITPKKIALISENVTISNELSSNILTNVVNGEVTILGPKITLDKAQLDFDRVPLQSNSVKSVYLKNEGNTDLNVSQLVFDDKDFTCLNSLPIVIKPDNSIKLDVKFTSTRKNFYSNSMRIESNDLFSSPKVELIAIGFSKNEIHIGTMLGASSSNSNLGVSINNMEDFVGFQFDLLLPESMTYNNEIPAKLARNQDHMISVNQIEEDILRVVSFSPSNKPFFGKEGKVLDLNFMLNGVGGSYGVGIKNVIITNASGENIASDSFDGTLNISSSDIDAATSLDFGDVSVLKDKTENLRIFNHGEEPLQITQLMFSSNFFQSNVSLPISISPSNYADLPITFSKNNAGISEAELKIVSNDPDENPFVVQLKGNSFDPNYLTINKLQVTQGDTGVIEINMENNDEIYAVQFDLTYPKGITLDILNAELSERKKDHFLAVSEHAENSIRAIIYSPTMKSLTGNKDAILRIPFKTELDMQPGTYEFIFSDALLSDKNSQNKLYTAIKGEIVVHRPYEIKLNSNPINGGVLTGAGHFNFGTEQTIRAVANDKYEFINWTENGSEVTKDSVFTVIMEKDLNLTANFKLKTGIEQLQNVGINVRTEHKTLYIEGAQNWNIKLINSIGQIVENKPSAGINETIQVKSNGIFMLVLEKENILISKKIILK